VPATHRSVRVDLDLSAGPVDLGCLEGAAVDFARRPPGELVAATVQSLTGELFDVIIDPKGFPLDEDAQPETPWACTRCGNRRGFRRHSRSGPRTRCPTPCRGAAEGRRCRGSRCRPAHRGGCHRRGRSPLLGVQPR